MKKVLFVALCLVGCFVAKAQNGATCPVTICMAKYEGKENVNISFLPRSLYMMLDNNGIPDDVLAEVKKLDRLNMFLFNKDAGDMSVYTQIVKDFEAVFAANGFVSLKNTSENGNSLKVFVKLVKDKPEGMCLIYDQPGMLDIFEFEGAFNVAKIPNVVKSISMFEKLAKKM